MIAEPKNEVTRYRTMWISDLHLGTKVCQAEALLKLLRETESDHLFLVGDMIDGWRLKRSWFWHQPYNDVLQKLLRKARKGTLVTYIPGNHDQFARAYAGMHFGGIEVALQAEHTTSDGRRLLILHGDEFDGIVTHARGLARLGGWAYEMSISLNHLVNRIRRLLGKPYWSLSACLKHRVKKAMMFIDNFEQSVVEEARRKKADGVVCGHIHRAAIKELGDITYYNTGDWVESCTVLVEHMDGSMELLHRDPFLEQSAEHLPEDRVDSHRPLAGKLGDPSSRMTPEQGVAPSE